MKAGLKCSGKGSDEFHRFTAREQLMPLTFMYHVTTCDQYDSVEFFGYILKEWIFGQHPNCFELDHVKCFESTKYKT